MVVLLWLSALCLVTVSVLWLFLVVRELVCSPVLAGVGASPSELIDKKALITVFSPHLILQRGPIILFKGKL